ncbi:uncharacterized protein [Onthophagus taurus]|uniref:uncharacterized protein n=1 Tax=Onthophagus taurus TaxID=166361 RepID=UPI0039BE4355
MKLTGKDGFSDWRHLATQLSRHESSIDHMFNYQKWNELKKRLSKNCTIDCEQQRYFESEKRRWRDIITRIVAIVQYLAGQCLAFRGDSDVLYERNNGNFLKGIEMLAKFDPIILHHINNIQKTRIVDMSTSPIEIKELFLGFYPVLDATGEGLFNFFTNELLSTYDLDVQNIRGQGYDDGSNMKGKKGGLQCRLKNVNPRAMCDAAFNKYINDATTLATDLDIEIEFPLKRQKKIVYIFDYECHDERIQDPKLLFEVEFYFTLLDTALNSIQERFTSLNECNELFKFLIEFRNMSEDDLRKSCADFDIALQVRNNDGDVDGEDLYNELIMYKILNEDVTDPLKNLQFIQTSGLISSFSNFSVALRIYLTLPVTVATGERSFSKLKLIKSYLRSSMCQERLSNLSLVAIEKELSEEINLDTVIDELANKKARKVQF